MPWRWIAVQAARVAHERGGAADGAGERCGVDRGELEAGGGAGVQRGDVGVDHRVGEAAGAGDDRHAAVAQAVELGEAAGLEARGDEDGVAAGLHQVGERLVVADDDADAAGELGGERAEGASRARGSPLPRTARRWPARTMSWAVIQARRSMPFCQVSRLTSTKSGRVVGVQAEARLERGAVLGAALQLAGGVGRGEQRVGLGVPDVGVDAVDDAVQRRRRGGDQAFEAHAVGRRS